MSYSDKDKEREYQKKYRKLNKEKIKKSIKRFHEKNPNKNNEYQIRFYKKYPEKKIGYQKRYLNKNEYKVKEYQREYHKFNKEKVKEYIKKFHEINPGKRNEYKKRFYKNHPNREIEYQKEYKKNHREELNKYSTLYRINNKDKINKYARNRRKTDMKYNLNNRMRVGIAICLKGNKNNRHWESLVDYSLNDLISRLKKTIPKNYTWDDFLNSKLHIDHIIPISAFNFIEPEHPDFKRCWALSNLQLLPAKENNFKRAKLDTPFQPSLIINLPS